MTTLRGASISIISAAMIMLLVLFCWFVPALKYIGFVLSLSSMESPSNLGVPVSGVKPREISDSFGAPRPGHRTHDGVDIFAARGTKILSPTPGIVLWRGYDRRGGNAMYILGPGFSRYYYAHLNEPGLFHAGSRIHSGQTIGYVGNSGNAISTPCHLHFEVIMPTKGKVNPYTLIVGNTHNRTSCVLMSRQYQNM